MMSEAQGAKKELLSSQSGVPIQMKVDPPQNDTVGSHPITRPKYDFSQEFYCDALDDKTVNTIADGSNIDVVVLVGFAGYGKTTFVSSLYYQLLTNVEYHGFIFFDSETYAGCERRFAIRTLKTNIDADTKRTIKGEAHILSFSLIDKRTNERRKLVVSDRSGEDYNEYIDNSDSIKDNELLKVANQILFFIDTTELMSNFHRVKYNYGLLLDGMKKHDIIPQGCKLSLVFNKHDHVKDEKEKNEEFELKAMKIKALFEQKLDGQNLIVFKVNSTGEGENFKTVDALYKDLLTTSSYKCPSDIPELDWVSLQIKKLKDE